MKNYLIVGLVVILGLAGIWFLAENSEDHAGQQTDQENEQPTEPEAFNPDSDRGEIATFTSQFQPGFSVDYPASWLDTASPDNSADKQLVTFESPQDEGGHYFCLDMTEVTADTEVDFATKPYQVLDVDAFAIDGLGQSLFSVIFNVEEEGNLLWSVIDDEISPDTKEQFDNQITSTSGRSLQVLGRFNCRDAGAMITDINQFMNSRWLNEAKSIIGSLDY